ncbi:MAG: hypothetical protein IT374_12015 [Polyangiaceae bacterium]|nr:hypothetical protein [Polyangiaceae bacterium]
MIRPRAAAILSCTLLSLLGACGDGGDSGGGTGPSLRLCEFVEDTSNTSNCFLRIVADAEVCVADSFTQPGALSADGLACSSSDGALAVTFGASPRDAQSSTLDFAVRRGSELCFSYRGPGSSGTPATFASGTTTLTMTSDSSNGDLVLSCDGKTWRGSLFTKCAAKSFLPGVGTSRSPGRFIASLPQDERVVFCDG